MDYHYAAERAYGQARPPGSELWFELTVDQRDLLADLVKAAEANFNEPPQGRCLDCEDLKDEVSHLEDVNDDLHHRLDQIHRLARTA